MLILNFIFDILLTGGCSLVSSVAFLGFRQLKWIEKHGSRVLHVNQSPSFIQSNISISPKLGTHCQAYLDTTTCAVYRIFHFYLFLTNHIQNGKSKSCIGEHHEGIRGA